MVITVENEKETKIFISHILDKAAECFNKNVPCATEFLDMQKQSLVLSIKRELGAGFLLWGGYEDAERKILIFLPDYEVDRNGFLSVIRAKHSSVNKLTHRDYLGSLMSLGIKREYIGDILVSESSADIIIKHEIEDYIYTNLSKAAKTSLSLTALPITELQIPRREVREITFSVSSLRVDCVLAAAFNLSRSRATEAVKAQLVYVNDILCLKPDKNLDLGDKITLRKKGRVILSDSGGKSRKGKTFVSAQVFK